MIFPTILSRWTSILFFKSEGFFPIQTSRGCPHRCGFCYNSVLNHRRWRGKSAKRVLDETEYILEKLPNVKCIDPVDDNFFVNSKRVEDICRGLIERRLGVSWRANCKFDYISLYDGEFISLLERSGCVEIDFGGETGSDRMLSLIGKDVTSEQMVTAVENLKKWGSSIRPYVSWTSSLPTETEEDLRQTFNLMDAMTEANEKTQYFGIFIYVPYPSPLLESLSSEFRLPNSLKEWSSIDIFHFSPPRHQGKYIDRLEAIAATSIFTFYPESRVKGMASPYRLGY
ncbi:MAG: B12-binding radical protein [Thermoproteota archaeon]|nr:B12-binding radical protein [Thermoproteota archaeon]